MADQDFYDTLGVDPKADDKAIKSAYRKLAMQYHPDRNPDDKDAEARFKDINAAYEILKDPQKRAAYDRFGHAAFQNGGAGAGGFNSDFGASMADIFDDLFGDFMGGGRRGARQNNRRGADLRYNMEITLEDAYSGKNAEIRVPSSAACDTCHGSGAKPGTGSKTCASCGGAGRVRASQGFFSIERTCPRCNGTGEMIETPCEDCGGAGRVARERTLSINIPPGVEDGTRIRLSGEGDAGLRGGPAGDLYIFLSLKPHDIFQRDGADLFCRVPISFTTAALGGSFDVPTLDGKRTPVKVPAGTQTGEQFRISGKGMPVLRSRQHGDLYVQTIVETPVKLTRRQRELLEEFDKATSEENTPDTHGFLSRVKDFFQGRADG
ncbi:MAG: molecular chaperone DnaJ [Rhodobiaceae bacterium]|nr:molecular chaperone DnaJ [Rhodobiaceae bacterium]MCC0016021.1 molecular chaperone DnaJ [Rhodobiaceae bacterium]